VDIISVISSQEGGGGAPPRVAAKYKIIKGQEERGGSAGGTLAITSKQFGANASSTFNGSASYFVSSPESRAGLQFRPNYVEIDERREYPRRNIRAECLEQKAKSPRGTGSSAFSLRRSVITRIITFYSRHPCGHRIYISLPPLGRLATNPLSCFLSASRRAVALLLYFDSSTYTLQLACSAQKYPA